MCVICMPAMNFRFPALEHIDASPADQFFTHPHHTAICRYKYMYTTLISLQQQHPRQIAFVRQIKYTKRIRKLQQFFLHNSFTCVEYYHNTLCVFICSCYLLFQYLKLFALLHSNWRLTLSFGYFIVDGVVRFCINDDGIFPLQCMFVGTWTALES